MDTNRQAFIVGFHCSFCILIVIHAHALLYLICMHFCDSLLPLIVFCSLYVYMQYIDCSTFIDILEYSLLHSCVKIHCCIYIENSDISLCQGRWRGKAAQHRHSVMQAVEAACFRIFNASSPAEHSDAQSFLDSNVPTVESSSPDRAVEASLALLNQSTQVHTLMFALLRLQASLSLPCH